MDAARMVGEDNIALCFGSAAFTIIIDRSASVPSALHDDDIACCCHDAFGIAGNGICGEGHIFF